MPTSIPAIVIFDEEYYTKYGNTQPKVEKNLSEAQSKLASILLNEKPLLENFLHEEISENNYVPLFDRLITELPKTEDQEVHNAVDRICKSIFKEINPLKNLYIDREFGDPFYLPLFIDTLIISLTNDPTTPIPANTERLLFLCVANDEQIAKLLELIQKNNNRNLIPVVDTLINSKFGGAFKFELKDNKLICKVYFEQYKYHTGMLKFLSICTFPYEIELNYSDEIDLHSSESILKSNHRLCESPILDGFIKTYGNRITHIFAGYASEIRLNIVSFHCPNLKSLSLMCGKFSSYKFLEQMPSLEHLSIKFVTPLHSIKIENVLNLLTLNIEMCLGVINSPSKLHICNLPKLTTLTCAVLEGLKTISIESLPQCKKATFNRCNLSNVKLDFLLQFKDTLENLDLMHNNLVSAPSELAELTHLKVLNLNDNKIGQTLFNAGSHFFNGFLSQSLQIPTPDYLRSIYDLENLVGLNLSNNSLRTLSPEIGNLKDLLILDLHSNHLSSIPTSVDQLTNLRNLNLNHNPLASLPLTLAALGPHLAELNLQNTLIGSLPPELDHLSSRTVFGQASYSFMIARNAGNTFIIDYDRKNIELETEKLIELLGQGLNMGHSDLSVKYLNEAGIDYSGLSKDIMTQLFTQIALKYLKEGIPSWYKSESLGEKRTDLFKQIGVILAFVLHTGRYPIGNIFTAEFFERLKNFPPQLLDSSPQNLSWKQLSDLLPKKDKQTINFNALQKFCEATDIESAAEYSTAVANIFAANGSKPTLLQQNFLGGIFTETIDDEEYYIIFSEDMLLELQLAVKKEVIEASEETLNPLFEIAKGFYQFKPMLEARAQLSADNLSIIIQGNSRREAVIAHLEYINGAECHKEVIKNWLEKAPQDKLENFLSYITGSRSIKAGSQKIKINLIPGQTIIAHACFNLLELPYKIDEETFNACLNALQPNEEFTTH